LTTVPASSSPATALRRHARWYVYNANPQPLAQRATARIKFHDCIATFPDCFVFLGGRIFVNGLGRRDRIATDGTCSPGH